MFREPLETWEVWVYPLLVMATMAWRSWPLKLHVAQVWRLEVLALTVVAVFEIWHSSRRRPGLARAVLIALSASVSFTLFNPGDPKLIYLITLALCVYLWLLEALPGWFGWLLERWRR